jgi:predicted Zn-dependent peptidase
MDNIYSLKNGIRAHFISTNSKLINLRIAFSIGSINDPVGKEGTVHLLEHLLVTWLENKKVSYILEDEGLTQNGSTTLNIMQLESEFIDKYAKEFFEEITKMFNNFRIIEKDFKAEKNAVKAELIEAEDSKYIEDKLEKVLAKTNIIKDYDIKRNETLVSIDNIKKQDIHKMFNKIKQRRNILFTVMGKINDKTKKTMLFFIENIKTNTSLENSKKINHKNITPIYDLSKKKYRYGIIAIEPHKANSDSYIYFKILRELLCGWTDSKIDAYTRNQLNASYSTNQYSIYTSHEMMEIFYFKIYNIKLLHTAMRVLTAKFFKPSLRDFVVAKSRAETNFIKYTNADKIDEITEINSLFKTPTTYYQYLNGIRHCNYNKFMTWYANIILHKITM